MLILKKTAKKGITVTIFLVRLSLKITIFYGTLLACVPVAVVHISSKSKLPHGHYTNDIIPHFISKVKDFSQNLI